MRHRHVITETHFGTERGEKNFFPALTLVPPGAHNAEPCALWCALLAAFRSCTFTVPSREPERPER